MKQSVDAVYENGCLKLLEPVDLQEGRRVRMEIDTGDVEDPLEVLARVYDGLSEREIEEIEAVVLKRGPLFSGKESP